MSIPRLILNGISHVIYNHSITKLLCRRVAGSTEATDSRISTSERIEGAENIWYHMWYLLRYRHAYMWYQMRYEHVILMVISYIHGMRYRIPVYVISYVISHTWCRWWYRIHEYVISCLVQMRYHVWYRIPFSGMWYHIRMMTISHTTCMRYLISGMVISHVAILYAILNAISPVCDIACNIAYAISHNKMKISHTKLRYHIHLCDIALVNLPDE